MIKSIINSFVSISCVKMFLFFFVKHSVDDSAVYMNKLRREYARNENRLMLVWHEFMKLMIIYIGNYHCAVQLFRLASRHSSS